MLTDAPDVLFSANSKLKKQLETIAWQEISVGTLNLDQLVADRGRAHVLALAPEEAQSVWSEVEEHALSLPLYPLVVSEGGKIATDASPLLRLAPVLMQPLEGLIQDTVRNLLQHSALLRRQLKAVDQETELLTQNSQCEWDRCSVGVVGVVSVPCNSSVPSLTEQLELLRLNAYAAIDRVPTARLSTDDLWTLLLVVAVPWNREELKTRDAESAILRTFVSDTIGSRKLILPSDEWVAALLGPVARSGPNWHPTSDDPIRDQLRKLVKNPEELAALEVLFKKRLSAEDFDRLVTLLGKLP
jgi:hypothetical protein